MSHHDTRDRVIEGRASYQEAREFIERLEARSLELDKLRKAYVRLGQRLRFASPHSLIEVTEQALPAQEETE
jgi:hypothetical protein